MAVESTCVLIKPDAMRLGFKKPILRRYICEEGFDLVAARSVFLSEELARRFYEEHAGKEFFPLLISFMSGQMLREGAETFALWLRGENAIQRVREINGATNPYKADPQSIRGTYREYFSTLIRPANFVHGSDSPEAATRELNLLF